MPARARTTASTSPDDTLPIRVSTLPRIADHVETETERAQLRGPARGAGADARTGRQLAEREAVAGDDDVARVLPDGHGGQRDLLVRGGRAGP